jgi:hypothetical protein
MDPDCGLDRICEAMQCRIGCRADADCPAGGEICDDATLLCRPGCRADGECGAEMFCNPSSNMCVSGCMIDTDCTAGRVCVGGMCRAGCRGQADCAADQFCSGASRTCQGWLGSGRCLKDEHCGTDKSCNLKALTCEGIPGTRTCSGTFCHDCGSGLACAGGKCVQRGSGAACGPDVVCGQDYECSPLDLECAPLRCQSSSCAPGLRCAYGSTCQSSDWMFNMSSYSYCTDFSSSSTCTTSSDCNSLPCASGMCSNARWPCASTTDCWSGTHVCVAGACAPYYEAPCADTVECGWSGLRCDTDVGHCARDF